MVFLFYEACKKGFDGLLKWVDELLTKIRGGVHADDLMDEVTELEEAIIIAKKPQSIYRILTNVRINLKN